MEGKLLRFLNILNNWIISSQSIVYARTRNYVTHSHSFFSLSDHQKGYGISRYLLRIRRRSVYMVTSLRLGRTSFDSRNCTKKLSLVEHVHSGSQTVPRIQVVPVVISTGKWRSGVEHNIQRRRNECIEVYLYLTVINQVIAIMVALRQCGLQQFQAVLLETFW